MWSLPQRFLRHFHGKPALSCGETVHDSSWWPWDGNDQISISEYLFLTRPKIFHICMYIHNYNCIYKHMHQKQSQKMEDEPPKVGERSKSRVDWPPHMTRSRNKIIAAQPLKTYHASNVWKICAWGDLLPLFTIPFVWDDFVYKWVVSMANHMIYTLRIPLDPCNATCNEFFFHGSLEIDGAQRVA